MTQLANKSVLVVVGGCLGLALVGGLVWVSMQWLGLAADSAVEQTTPVRPPRGPRGGGNEVAPAVPQDPGELPAAKGLGNDPRDVENQAPFVFEGYEVGLDAVDWSALSGLLFHLAKDLPQLGFGVDRRDISPELTERIHPRVSALERQLLASRKHFPGVGPFGVLTNPAFYPNALAKTLEAAGRPLTAEQVTSLRALAEAMLEKDTQRIAGLSNGAVHARKAVSEVVLRSKFVDQARALLSERQRIAVGAGPYENRVGLDPLSPAMYWHGMAHPVPVDERDLCIHQIFGDILVPLVQPPDEKSHDEAMAFLDPWWERVPSPPRTKSGMLTIAGHPKLGPAVDGARFTAELLEALLEKYKFRDDQFRMAQLRREIVYFIRHR